MPAAGHALAGMRCLCLLLFSCGDASLAPNVVDTNESAVCGNLLPTDQQWNWQWKKQGVVAGLPAGVLSPALLADDTGVRLWFSHGNRIWHARSEDGVTFTDVTLATGLGDGHIIANPSVWREDGTLKMIFGSGSFDVATSSDGVHWTISEPRVMTPSYDPARFDAYSLLYPSRLGDLVYFSAYDGQRVRIGRARDYVVEPTTPVLDVGTGFDNTAVAQPHVRRFGARWVMWYGGYDTSLSDPGPYRIGVAESEDGISWNKRGVVIDLSPKGSDAWSARDPALVPIAGRWSMYYVGLGDDGVYRLHRATSSMCVLVGEGDVNGQASYRHSSGEQRSLARVAVLSAPR